MTVAVLDRPERRNALDLTTVIELRTKLAAGDGPVVLTGAGGTFCSGFDLTTRGEGADFKVHADRLFETILGYPAPVIAALNGPAVGMGVVLAATCDLRIGGPGVWLEIPAARLGVVLDRQYVWRVRDRLGMSAAQLLLLAPDRVSGAMAAELGALHAVADDPLEAAKGWAARLVQLSPVSLAAQKAFLNDDSCEVAAMSAGGSNGSG